MGWWKNAFAIERTGVFRPNPRQEELLDRLARMVVRRGMAVPAVLFLESVKPLNFVGSQVLVFFSPIVKSFFTMPEWDEFTELLEHREAVDLLMQKIEHLEKGGPAGAAPDPCPPSPESPLESPRRAE